MKENKNSDARSVFFSQELTFMKGINPEKSLKRSCFIDCTCETTVNLTHKVHVVVYITGRVIRNQVYVIYYNVQLQ